MNNLEKAMKEIKLKTKDGIDIAVNHYNKDFDSVIILAPGWFMTKDSKSFLEMSEIFNNKSDVLTIDFRGHGRSKGFYTFTSKEVEDIIPNIPLTPFSNFVIDSTLVASDPKPTSNGPMMATPIRTFVISPLVPESNDPIH